MHSTLEGRVIYESSYGEENPYGQGKMKRCIRPLIIPNCYVSKKSSHEGLIKFHLFLIYPTKGQNRAQET
jgi:hypothetical protein